jgi:hypothetical protein
MTFTDLLNIYKLGLQYSFTISRGEISYQHKGCPIGGYLSAFYANTVCAYHEYKYMTSLKHTAKKIYGIRQMDDLLIWIATKKGNKGSYKQATRMKKQILRNNGVYLGGLELEEETVKTIWIKKEKHYIHEFSGTEIKVRAQNPTMTCKTLNKNKHSIAKNEGQIIARYPPWESYTTQQSKRGVIIGTLHRIEQQNSTIELAAHSMLDNYKEYRAIGYATTFYVNVLQKITKHATVETERLATIATETVNLIKRDETQKMTVGQT